MTDPLIYGQPIDWDQSNEGHLTTYLMDPALIPADQTARVIYELRQDVARLNTEAMDYFDRLRGGKGCTECGASPGQSHAPQCAYNKDVTS